MRCARSYFLNDGLVSLLAITEAGQTVDICTIGREGVVGLPIVLNVPIMPCRVVNQLPCEALLIKSAPLVAEFKRGGTLQRLLLKYAYVRLWTAVSDDAVGRLPFVTFHPRATQSLVVGDR